MATSSHALYGSLLIIAILLLPPARLYFSCLSFARLATLAVCLLFGPASAELYPVSHFDLPLNTWDVGLGTAFICAVSWFFICIVRGMERLHPQFGYQKFCLFSKISAAGAYNVPRIFTSSKIKHYCSVPADRKSVV